jgi:hypothetical protein
VIKNRGNHYENVKVSLDNNEFFNCTFVDCIMEYAGTGPVSISNCKFTNPQWVFVGAAQNTLQFMHAVYQGMGEVGKQLIEKTCENIKKSSASQFDSQPR